MSLAHPVSSGSSRIERPAQPLHGFFQFCFGSVAEAETDRLRAWFVHEKWAAIGHEDTLVARCLLELRRVEGRIELYPEREATLGHIPVSEPPPKSVELAQEDVTLVSVNGDQVANVESVASRSAVVRDHSCRERRDPEVQPPPHECFRDL